MSDFYGTIAYRMMLAANMLAGFRTMWSTNGLEWYTLIPTLSGSRWSKVSDRSGR
jgi:hypothetical protein